jgi:hypothetical protein
MLNDHRSLLLKCSLATALLTGFLMLPGAQQVRADGCQQRVSRADHNLHEAIEDHGYESKQAEHARHELREVREACWNSDHRWWDPDQKRWHTDRDWDDNDHRDYRHRDRDDQPNYDPDRH